MKLDLPQIETNILKYWKKDKVFEKSLKKTKSKPNFVFYEGPPFANGKPGIHHLLARAFKDVILRYKTMQGFYVSRRAGWDTHGLPTEMAAEKQLGIKSKKEIEELGIDKFIDTCQNNIFTYKKEWEEFTERIGFWLDFENAYITCSNEYVESLWWILKQIWDKKLLYQDYKVVPYCPRCGTSLSSHEVAQGYKKVKENSVYVKLELKSSDASLLVWTTTPWTLPGNTGVAVNPKLDYVKVKVGSDNLILAKQRLSVLEDYKVIEEIKGKDLLGLEYEPLFSFTQPDKKAYFVVKGDFVNTDEGTGLVHMAPAFGEDDMQIAKQNNLPVLMTIDSEGKFKKEVADYSGKFVKDADPLIIQDLEKRDLLYKQEMYEHEYPFCWRCKSPLLYYAKQSWFIKMTDVKKDLIKNSQKINWVPAHIKEGRFGEWIKEVKDWNLSRERYWGTTLPIWECDKCKEQVCFGGIKDLEKASGRRVKDLHRPRIDKVVFKCKKCDGQMKRVPEVIDCWFDSGSMPFAQWHYPFENKVKIDKGESYPADYISEGIDQTRGWFYTLLAISTLLGKGASYKNVVSLGLVMDEKGKKMSKSRGNIVVPKEAIDRFGADCARLYFYTVNQAGETKRFDFKDVQDLYRKFFDTLWQSYSFFSIYNEDFKFKKGFKSKNILDKWIVSRLENVNLKVNQNLDKFDIVASARLFQDFVDDLSNWYIRRSRQRFQTDQKQEASQTLYFVLLKLSQLLAPFTPFISEELYQRLNGKESVHLSDYPKSDKKLINNNLEKQMKEIREMTTLGLAQRAEAGIKVRQPLQKLEIDKKFGRELLELLKQEVNVKEVVVGKKVQLDTKITQELEKEGKYREMIRNVNKLRKELKLTPKDRIEIKSTYQLDNIEEFKKEVKADTYSIEDKIEGDNVLEIKIDKDKKDYLLIKKVN